MLFALLDGPVPPGAAVLDTLQYALAIQDVHYRHDGRVRDRAVVPQPLPYLAHHARALGGPHHVHDGHLKFTELAHLAAPPCTHVSTEHALSGVPQLVQGRKAAPWYSVCSPRPQNFHRAGYQAMSSGRRRPVGQRRGGRRREVDLTPAGDAARPGSLGHALMGAARPPVTRRKRAMSAVPPESPRASADPSEHTTEHSGAESQAGNPGTDFGPNEWLVDELYQRYLADPSSVAMEWWNFFADYRPPPGRPARPVAAAARAAAPAPAPAAPAPPPAPAMPATPASGAAGNAAPPQAPPAAPAAP